MQGLEVLGVDMECQPGLQGYKAGYHYRPVAADKSFYARDV